MNTHDTAPKLTPVRAGFIPLIDCAGLVVAKEKGFAQAQGIDLQLYKDVSWANIRDHINIGTYDIAHMLAAMPIAANLGIGHVKVPMVAPLALSSGGNAITLSQTLYNELARAGANDLNDPKVSAQALATVIGHRRAKDQDQLVFGMVFPFSCHNYQLRYWMAEAGIDPDQDVQLVVIPPAYMVKSLQTEQIDGFCVGEPWNSMAAQQGVGQILMPTTDVWPLGPEKVLGMQAGWANGNSDTLAAVLRALDEAARWTNDRENQTELAQILAHPQYLNVPSQIVNMALNSGVSFYGDGVIASHDEALWLYAQMVRWGQTLLSTADQDVVRQTYRPDILFAALGKQTSQATIPNITYDFNPNDIEGYIQNLPVKMPKK